jgi:hypothetical protein
MDGLATNELLPAIDFYANLEFEKVDEVLSSINYAIYDVYQ